MNSKSIIASLSVAVIMGLSTVAQAHHGIAMTWKTKTVHELRGPAGKIGNQRIVVVGCSQCNAYKGDTKITEKRHILCITPGNAPEPAVYNARFSAHKFYYNWSGAKIGLSKRRIGSTITSRAVGDQFCKADLNDSQARMIEHHDNKVGGWNVGGFIHPNSKAPAKLRLPKAPNNATEAEKNKLKPHKFWAAIRNQKANPWN